MKALFSAVIAAARSNKDDERLFRLGCIAIRADGAWVSACNASATQPTPSGHAEVRALRKAGLGATLIVARVKRDGSLGMALPCARCRSMIKAKRVVRVYYSHHDGSFHSYYPEDY